MMEREKMKGENEIKKGEENGGSLGEEDIEGR